MERGRSPAPGRADSPLAFKTPFGSPFLTKLNSVWFFPPAEDESSRCKGNSTFFLQPVHAISVGDLLETQGQPVYIPQGTALGALQGKPVYTHTAGYTWTGTTQQNSSGMQCGDTEKTKKTVFKTIQICLLLINSCIVQEKSCPLNKCVT